MQQVEADVPGTRGRIELHRDGDEPEAHGPAPDRARCHPPLRVSTGLVVPGSVPSLSTAFCTRFPHGVHGTQVPLAAVVDAGGATDDARGRAAARVAPAHAGDAR